MNQTNWGRGSIAGDTSGTCARWASAISGSLAYTSGWLVGGTRVSGASLTLRVGVVAVSGAKRDDLAERDSNLVQIFAG